MWSTGWRQPLMELLMVGRALVMMVPSIVDTRPMMDRNAMTAQKANVFFREPSYMTASSSSSGSGSASGLVVLRVVRFHLLAIIITTALGGGCFQWTGRGEAGLLELIPPVEGRRVLRRSMLRLCTLGTGQMPQDGASASTRESMIPVGPEVATLELFQTSAASLSLRPWPCLTNVFVLVWLRRSRKRLSSGPSLVRTDLQDPFLGRSLRCSCTQMTSLAKIAALEGLLAGLRVVSCFRTAWRDNNSATFG